MLGGHVGVLESLLPIFLVIGLGAALTARGFLTAETLRQLNRLAYWVGMPGLLFASVAEARISGTRPLLLSAVLIVATFVSLGLSWVMAWRWRLAPSAFGTFMQGAFRGNLAFVGLPVLALVAARPDAPPEMAGLVTVAVLAMAPVMILYNILAVVVLVASHQPVKGAAGRSFLRQVATNPLVLAVGAGLVVALAGVELPRPLLATAQVVGGLAVPAALFGVGGTLILAPWREHLRLALVATLLKIAVIPLVAWAAAVAMGLSSIEVATVVTLGATPTAAASFIMATQLRGDAGLASSMITLTTLGSIASLGLALLLF